MRSSNGWILCWWHHGRGAISAPHILTQQRPCNEIISIRYLIETLKRRTRCLCCAYQCESSHIIFPQLVVNFGFIHYVDYTDWTQPINWTRWHLLHLLRTNLTLHTSIPLVLTNTDGWTIFGCLATSAQISPSFQLIKYKIYYGLSKFPYTSLFLLVLRLRFLALS